MLLSIIVPTYNVEEFIANCLESLLEQDIPKESYEVLVINDGSTDDSGKIAGTFADNHKNVVLINQENKGLSGARNTGISLAKGKYIYFIDSDDYIAKNTLGLIMDLLEKNNLDVLGIMELETTRLDIKKSKNIEAIDTTKLKVTDGITFLAENNYLNNAWWYFIKLDFLRETKLTFPVGRMVEDANFTAKLLVASKKMALIPLDFYRYYLRPNSIMRRKNISHVRKLIYDYEKNIYEFNDQIKELRSNTHPKISECLTRLEARQESFVFFLLVKSIRYGLSKEEVAKIIDGLKGIGVYPIQKFIGVDYKKLIFKILQPMINKERVLYILLKLGAIAR